MFAKHVFDSFFFFFTFLVCPPGLNCADLHAGSAAAWSKPALPARAGRSGRGNRNVGHRVAAAVSLHNSFLYVHLFFAGSAYVCLCLL